MCPCNFDAGYEDGNGSKHTLAACLLGLFLAETAAQHAADTNQDERDGEQLPHVQEHALLKADLIFLDELNQYAAGEDDGEAVAEEESGADFLLQTPVEPPAEAKGNGIADGLVELARMAGKHVHALEDESPRLVGGASYNFAVHEIAHADGTGAKRRDNGYIVEHAQETQLLTSGIQVECQHEANGAAVAGKALVAGEHPALSGNLLGRQYHLKGMGQIVAGFVEEAMPESGA